MTVGPPSGCLHVRGAGSRQSPRKTGDPGQRKEDYWRILPAGGGSTLGESQATREFSSVQFSSVAQSRLTLCNPMDYSTPGLPVHHQLQEFTPGLFFPNYQKSKRVPEKHLLLLYWLCQSLCGSPQTVDHHKLWKILKEIGIPDHLTCLLWNLYAGQEATVRTGRGTTDWVQIGKGVRRGCMLSPCLFNLYAEYIMRNAGLKEAQAGIKIARRNINNLRYADDTTFMATREGAGYLQAYTA